MQTFRKLDLFSVCAVNIMFDEVNTSVNLSLFDLATLTSDSKAKVKYNYYDTEFETKKLDQADYIFNDITPVNDDVCIKYIKHKIKDMSMNKNNFISQIRSIIWKTRGNSGEKFYTYLFRKCNKILEIETRDNDLTLLLDHPIDEIFDNCFKISIIIGKNLLQRDLCYDEYVTLILHKLNTNIICICIDDIGILKNLVLNNPDDIDVRILYIFDKIIINWRKYFMGNAYNILDIIVSTFYYDKVIACNDINIIINIIKFATNMCDYDTIAMYSEYVDYNNIDIEKCFQYVDAPKNYIFFSSLLENNIYEIKLDKICCSNINDLSLLIYFIKAYYHLDDFNVINIDDYVYDLPTETIRKLIINNMDDSSIARMACIATNINFVKYFFPNILSTDSLELSRYYEQLCRAINNKIFTDEDTDTYHNNYKICSAIKEEIDDNIRSGLICCDKFISDIINTSRSHMFFGVDSVLGSLENILGKQYFTLDNFDLLIMGLMSKIDFIGKANKKYVQYICSVINNYLPCAYYDQYKNHYLTYLLNFAIDYINIDGDYLVLPDENISLHVNDFKFYPFFALIHTDNPHIISYVIDNYKLADLSVIRLILYNGVFSSSSFFSIKFIKKYFDILKSHLHQQQLNRDFNSPFDMSVINFDRVENIRDITIE
jgi:hypothetical protein